VVLDLRVSHEPTGHRSPDSLTLAGDYIPARSLSFALFFYYYDTIGTLSSAGFAKGGN